MSDESRYGRDPDPFWDKPFDWISNPWGWPCIFGLGAAQHPIDVSHEMLGLMPKGWVRVWDERLQLEYGVPNES